jgi:hypothetical protein
MTHPTETDREPMPRVASIRFSRGAARKKPKQGDRRVTKKHGLQIRVMAMVHDSRGQPIGFDCTGGRQRYEWRAPQELRPSDRYLLTPEERAQYFPPEREPGYMQQRGAA